MKKKKLLYALLEIIILIILIVLLVLAYNAHQAMKRGQALLANGNYAAAQEEFSKAGGHENSPDYAKYAQALQQVQDGKLDDAQAALTKLGSFEEAPSYLGYVAARKAQDAKEWQAAIDGYTGTAPLLDSTERAQECRAALSGQQYQEAAALYEQGEYEKAGELYAALGDYSDSADRAAEIQNIVKTRDDYARAVQLQSEGNLQEAYDILSVMEPYEDSAERAAALKTELALSAEYQAADALAQSGKLAEARQAFLTLGSYRDSADRAAALKTELALSAEYQAADALAQSGNLEDARQAFLTLGSYSDSTDRASALRDQQNETIYQTAATAEKNGQVSEAYAGYLAVGEYKDAPAKVSAILQSIQDADDKVASAQEEADAAAAALKTVSREDQAAFAAAQKKADDANKALDAAKDASPNFDKGISYQFALQLIKNGQWEQARSLLAGLKGYGNAEAKLAEVDAELTNQKLYREACAALQGGDLVAAQTAFEALGNYKDSAAQLGNIKQAVQGTPDAEATATAGEKAEFVDADGVAHQYQVFEGCETWDEARQYCESVGGHLATLTSEEENQFVYDYIVANGYKSAYFGLSDMERTGAWAWVTGEPFDYADWHEGEPNRSSNEKYGMYLSKFAGPTWNDCHFGEGTSSPGAPFICEWDH